MRMDFLGEEVTTFKQLEEAVTNDLEEYLTLPELKDVDDIHDLYERYIHGKDYEEFCKILEEGRETFNGIRIWLKEECFLTMNNIIKIIIMSLICVLIIGTVAADKLIVTSDIDNSTIYDTTKSDSGSQTISGISNNAGLQNNNREIETDDGYYVYDHMENDNDVKVKKEGESKAEQAEQGTILNPGDRVYFSDPVYLRAKYNYTAYRGVTVEVQDDIGNAGKTTTYPKMKRTGDSVTVLFHEPVDYDSEKYAFIGISYRDNEGNYHTFQPGETFTVNYDDILPGENTFFFTYLYDEKVIVDPIPDEDIEDDDNETVNNTDTDDIDTDINNTATNITLSSTDNDTEEISCELVDIDKPVGKDKNNGKPITLPKTGTNPAILIGAILVLFVVCLACWRDLRK